MEDKIQGKKPLWRRCIPILTRVILVVLSLLLILLVLINIPPVQTFIARKAVSAISSKTGAEIHVGEVKIKFPKQIVVHELLLRDLHKDTLLYMHSLEVNARLLRLLRNEVVVSELKLDGLVSHIRRTAKDNSFNFGFLLDAFKSKDTITKKGHQWVIDVKKISLKNVNASFNDEISGVDAGVRLGNFETTIDQSDLNSKMLNLKSVLLENTNAFAAIVSKNSSAADTVIAQKMVFDIADTFIKFQITAGELIIRNTDLRFDNNSFEPTSGQVDYNHLKLSGFNTEIYNISLSKKGYRANIRNLSFMEHSGFELKHFSALASLSGNVAEVKNLKMETTWSAFSLEASMSYSKSVDLVADPWNCPVKLDVSHFVCNMDELFTFVPELAENEMFSKFKGTEVILAAHIEGKIDDLDIKALDISALQQTRLKTRGRISGLISRNEPEFVATIDNFNTNQHDIFMFADRRQFGDMKLPQSVSVRGTASSKNDVYKGKLVIATALGSVTTDGIYIPEKQNRRDSFNVVFNAENISAGLILTDTMLGNTAFSGHAAGSGLTRAPLAGNLKMDVHDLTYNHYTYHDIRIDSRLKDSVVHISAVSTDSNFNMLLHADASLKGKDKSYSTAIELKNMNFMALHFSDRNISIASQIEGKLNYRGPGDSDGKLDFSKSRLTSNGESVYMKRCNFDAFSEQDSVQMSVSSDLADGIINGNLNIDRLIINLRSAFRKYFGLADTQKYDVNKDFAFKMDVHIPKGFTEFFVTDLDSLVISRLQGSYNSIGNKLNAQLDIPKVIYSDNQLDSLQLELRGLNDSLVLDLEVEKIKYKELHIDKLKVREYVYKGKIRSDIQILDSAAQPKYLFSNNIDLGKNYFKIKFLPGGLILDGKSWKVHADNYFEIHPNDFNSQNFSFTNDNQSIGLETNASDLKLKFDKFGLENILNMVQYNVPGMNCSGNLTGEVVFPTSVKNEFADANLTIDHLYVFDTIPGFLNVKVKSEDDILDIDTRYENEQNKIKLKGTIGNLSKIPIFDLKAMIDFTNIHQFEKYTFGYLSQLGGKMKGDFIIKGTSSKPEYTGMLAFNETVMKINSLNFLARIKDEKVNIDQKGAHFKDFVIEDINGRKLTANGDILSKDFKEFAYNLHLTTDEFQPINSTAADNPVLYGKLSLNTDVMLTGDVNSPRIEAHTKINPATNITYALPGSELKLVTPEGIVYFLEPSQSFDSIYSTKKGDYLTDSIISKLKGYDLILNFEVEQGAVFTLDIDPKSGDSLTVSGAGKLNITSDRTGKQSITGVYVVKKGNYLLSFYGLVKKNFTILPESRITWSGKPMDAELNITAEYVVRTSSVSLVSNETTNMSDAEKNIFNQRLPYEIKLNIRGFLSKPEISFSIALPDKYLVTYPLIASKLAVLNTEEMVSQLNKQVFSLLVTGSFMADNPLEATGTSSTPTSVATTAARNSVNGILADQMNKASSKYIDLVDLNFGLTTYENYDVGETETRTELDVQVSKKLMNDRLNVEALGSFDVATDKNKSVTDEEKITGEFSVTYSLTESGEYKLRAYYQNAYDFFDGDISYSGIAFIFEKEMDSLKRKKKDRKQTEPIKSKETDKNQAEPEKK
jgi:hypothetical protein